MKKIKNIYLYMLLFSLCYGCSPNTNTTNININGDGGAGNVDINGGGTVISPDLSLDINANNKTTSVVYNCDELQIENESLHNEYDNLQVKYDEVITTLNNLQTQYDGLKVQYDDIKLEYDNLQKENAELLLQVEQLKSNGESVINNEEPTQEDEKIVYLNELPVFNCQYFYINNWHTANIPKWDCYEDKTADGNTHDNAVHMAVSVDAGLVDIYVIDYLLNGEYNKFNGKFMLDEISKSTPSVATLTIYGTMEGDPPDKKGKILFVCNNITGGLAPQDTGDIIIEDIVKLSFEFKSNNGWLGNSDSYNRHFGVVFYDTVLN